jgi:hypothetical protein
LHTLHRTKTTLRALNTHACTTTHCPGCSATSTQIRTHLSTSFAHLRPVQAAQGEIAIFRTGEKEGAIHSEPKHGEGRVFVGVVPGSEEGLRGLMGRWGMGFPRAWCLGIEGRGVGSDEFGW